MANMLANSSVTITVVVPGSHAVPEVKSVQAAGARRSNPAEGSSKQDSGSRAMARAMPARFFIPPLIRGIKLFESGHPHQSQFS